MMFRALSLMAALLLSAPCFADEAAQPAQENRMLFQLTNDDAQDAIAQALTEKGAGQKLTATIVGRSSDVLFSYNRPVTAEIHGLRYEATTHRWNASILFKAGEEVVSAVPASGRYEEIVELPMLKHEVRHSDIITQEDLEMRAVPQSHARSDLIQNISDIVGKSPLRSISAQRPIRANEVASPAVIKKNAIVQLRFESDGISIATSGQAMEDGAIGEVIDVRNVASKRIVKAQVENAGSVRVIPPGSLPAASMTAISPQSAVTSASAVNTSASGIGGLYAATN